MQLMKEIRTIITAYDIAKSLGISVALATVVRVEGSSYRRTGARMLVQDNGIWEGGISGGCLEGDALKQARMAIFKESPSLITYDTSQEDEYQIGVGLGCNGIIDVLFAPLDFLEENNAVEILKKCVADNRKTHLLLTFTNVHEEFHSLKSGQVIRYKDVRDLQFIEDRSLQSELSEKIIEQLQKGTSAPVSLKDERVSVFIELLPPPIHLIIMGYQYDVFPLSRLTHEMGWETTVVAPAVKVNRKIKELVNEIISNEKLNEIKIDEYTAVVLMSHDLEKDKENLQRVLKTDVSYIGMLGPKVRSERIFDELKEAGIIISEKDKSRIYAPIGLDIGAVSPEEIALSLVAEIRAIFSERSGGSLRLRNEPIHERN